MEEAIAESVSAPSQQERRPEPTVGEELKTLLIKIGVIAGIAIALFTFVYGIHYNKDPGMDPAVKDGDLVLFNRWDKDYRAGDLAVLKVEGERQIRRVIAVGGETVNITADGLEINGALQQELGISQKTEMFREGIDFPVTLGEGEVFLLGDAREAATDSRIYGPVDTDDTEGTAFTLLRRRNL